MVTVLEKQVDSTMLEKYVMVISVRVRVSHVFITDTFGVYVRVRVRGCKLLGSG